MHDQEHDGKKTTPALGEGPGEPKTFAQALADLWNELVRRPRVLELSETRRRHIARRQREHPDLNWWRDAIERIAATPFLRGAGSRGWTANFDWLIANDTNALKVLEGRYDDRRLSPRDLAQHYKTVLEHRDDQGRH